MVFVENAADAHLRAADALGESASAVGGSTVGGKAYFISQAEPVNLWQWINDILALVNLPPVTKSVSLPAARRIGAACEAFWNITGLRSEPPMTRFLARQLATSHWFDVTAAKRDFGYEPKVSTVEGMERLRDWLHGIRNAQSEPKSVF
jgi:nucleoside-diphosphate-sugar epimerase